MIIVSMYALLPNWGFSIKSFSRSWGQPRTPREDAACPVFGTDRMCVWGSTPRSEVIRLGVI